MEGRLPALISEVVIEYLVDFEHMAGFLAAGRVDDIFARGAHHLPELAQLPRSSEWTLSKYSKSEYCFAQSIT